MCQYPECLSYASKVPEGPGYQVFFLRGLLVGRRVVQLRRPDFGALAEAGKKVVDRIAGAWSLRGLKSSTVDQFSSKVNGKCQRYRDLN